MKKIIVTLVIAVSSLSVFAGTTSNEENVNQKVLTAFKTEFTSAKDVEWTVSSGYYKATFVYNERYVFAYYSENGELLGLTRYLSPLDLPLALQNNLKKNYESYWVSDLFEAVKSDETHYYITVENADTKLVLRSSGNSWSTYSKTKKS
ncbi:MAG TPA: hypothetical protein VGO58_05910 [Chitinophagaceae bacterium]|jgi:hypothetical protein|nr:hypothetical protein [Chitinophagaceae bacterium]